MRDSEADLASPGRLGDFLQACQQRLFLPYLDADRSAIRSQTRYRVLIFFAALLTTLALFLDAGQLAFQLPRGFSWAELGLATISAVLVGIALHGHWQKEWLLRRYQAERYRLLKFRILADPLLWTSTHASDWQDRLEEGKRRIEKLRHHSLEEEASEEEIAEIPAAGARMPGHEDVTRLLDYYERKRLTAQIDYFDQAVDRNRSLWLDPLWVPAIFFLSMAIVIAHFFMELKAPHGRESGVSRTFGVLPILLPALLTGFRLKVTANEVARNRSRSLARRSSLQQIADRLGGLDRKQVLKITGTVRETREPPGVRISRKVEGALDPRYVFSHLALAEQILASDQREWLRLMLEAEWYK
jgi:hypothetical protein